MNNHEKLLELLQKDFLCEEEKLLIQRLVNEDKETENLYNFYKTLHSVVKHSSHLSTDQIRDYIFFKNHIEPEDNSIVKTIPFIELHLRNCEKCCEEFKALNEEYNEINFYANSGFSKSLHEQANSSSKQHYSFPRYFFMTIIAIGLLYSALFVISQLALPDYYAITQINETADFYVTRGRATDAFQKSLIALEKEKFDEAIGYLKLDVKNGADDRTVFYSHYILGLIYLEKSREDFIGLFPHFIQENAEKALSHFRAAIQENKSGKFNNITLDAYFYSAKANLILNKAAEAREDLNIVINKKGGKMLEAQKILTKIE